jgi:anti-sigma regulatory factor (Ser/Thr protein kinase)/biotin operon repressor
MPTRDSILAFLQQQGSSGSKVLCRHLGISRQALNVHLNRLIDEGGIVRTGATRNTRYSLPGQLPKPKSYGGEFDTEGLDENHLYQRLALSLNLSHALNSKSETVFQYVFTEMLNNAIDHSESGKVRVSASLEPGFVKAGIRDSGIGVFASIADKLFLADEHDALLQLVKGKTTTMPEAHTGEGIFFSSKVATTLAIRSHRIEVEWNKRLKDVFVSNRRFVKGTHVQIEVRRDTRTRLEDIFNEFAPQEFDYEFSRSKVHVKLLGEKYISRSEARRLLVNLEKFKHIELDFKNVESVGQGFADEVFRVFSNDHPGIVIHPVNTSPAVGAMIQHAGSQGSWGSGISVGTSTKPGGL